MSCYKFDKDGNLVDVFSRKKIPPDGVREEEEKPTIKKIKRRSYEKSLPTVIFLDDIRGQFPEK